MPDEFEEITPPEPTDGSADAIIRECTADAAAIHELFDVPPIVERLDTQFSYTKVVRADRLFRLRDGSLWHIEWQGKRDPTMFARMIDYWSVIRDKVDATARIRSDIVLVGKAPRDWVVKDWIGNVEVVMPVTDFRRLDVTPLFEKGNASDMLLGVLGGGGIRPENLMKVVAAVTKERPHQRDRLISMLGRMIELRGEAVVLPIGVQRMIEALDIDYERNPVFRRPYELGRSSERRRQALNLLEIAKPNRSADNERDVRAVPDDKLDDLIAAVSNYLRVRTADAVNDMDTALRRP